MTTGFHGFYEKYLKSGEMTSSKFGIENSK